MTGQSFVDTFCHHVKAKYNYSNLTVEKIGTEYARVLMGEALAGERILGEKFVGAYLPFPELRGFHHRCASGRLTIGFDRTDCSWEQLRTKLHELGEHILNRLAVFWPDFSRRLRYLQEIEDDAVADRFTDGVLAKLVPVHMEVTWRMLVMRLAMNITKTFLMISQQMMERVSPGSSRYVSGELVRMPAQLEGMIILFYQHLTDYVLLRERENSLSAEEILDENCPVCRTMLEK